MPSFDVVCEVDLQEVDNAVNQTAKEITTRFDFKGGKSSVTFDKTNKTIKIVADDELKLRAIHGILEMKMARRSLDCRALKYGDQEPASGNIIRQQVTLREGLTKEEAKSIIKRIKDGKLKVQAQIQDEQVRVTGKKIDDLQSVIADLRSANFEFPLQYTNMKS